MEGNMRWASGVLAMFMDIVTGYWVCLLGDIHQPVCLHTGMYFYICILYFSKMFIRKNHSVK